jgi:hypothetical protein
MNTKGASFERTLAARAAASPFRSSAKYGGSPLELCIIFSHLSILEDTSLHESPHKVYHRVSRDAIRETNILLELVASQKNSIGFGLLDLKMFSNQFPTSREVPDRTSKFEIVDIYDQKQSQLIVPIGTRPIRANR